MDNQFAAADRERAAIDACLSASTGVLDVRHIPNVVRTLAARHAGGGGRGVRRVVDWATVDGSPVSLRWRSARAARRRGAVLSLALVVVRAVPLLAPPA
jgi:hypothetical protein